MLKIVSFGVLALLAVGALFFPAQARRVAGLRPLETPRVADLDDLRQLREIQPGTFFDERYRMELTVPREMTLDTFLRLNNIRLPHVRDQIREQLETLRGEPVGDNPTLRPEESFQITLVPPQEL